MSNEAGPDHPLDLVDRQIQELLKTELTNIRYPAGAELEEVIGEVEIGFSQGRIREFSGFMDYVLELHESADNARRMGAGNSYEVQSDAFFIHIEPPKKELGPRARVLPNAPAHLRPSTSSKMEAWIDDVKREIEAWRKDIGREMEAWREEI